MPYDDYDPIPLRDYDPIPLRRGLREALYSPERMARLEAERIADSSEFTRGWTSSDLGGKANGLWAAANAAYNDAGRFAEGSAEREAGLRRGQRLEAQANAMDQQAAQWAPSVPSFSDVHSLSDLAKWAGGSAGNLRTSLEPLAGSLAGTGVGAGLGALAGTFLFPGVGTAAGASIGSTLGGGFGAFLPGAEMETNESIAEAMRDPEIRATRGMGEIRDTGLTKGVVAGGLEAVVPFGVARSLVGRGARDALKALTTAQKAVKAAKTTEEVTQATAALKAAEDAVRATQGSRLARFGKEVGKSSGEEFLTEGAQSLTGQSAQNYLKGQDLTNYDWAQAFDEAMAGAVPGGGMGVLGGVGEAARGRSEPGGNGGGRGVMDLTADAIVGTGGLLGKGAAKGANVLGNIVSRVFDGPGGALEQIIHPPHGRADDASQRGNALVWAEHVLKNPDTFDETERKEANAFVNGELDLNIYRDNLTIRHRTRQAGDALRGIAEELNEGLTGKNSKASRLAPQSEEAWISSQLADLWLRTEGLKIKPFSDLLESDAEFTEASNTSALLMEWVNSGFGASYNDGETFIPKRLVDELGADAPRVVGSMFTLARRQGTFRGDLKDAKRVLDEVARASSEVRDRDVILNNLAPLAEGRVTAEDAEELASEIHRLVEVRAGEPQLSPEDQSRLVHLFGENAGKVVEHFVHRRTKIKSSAGRGIKAEHLDTREDAGDENDAGTLHSVDEEGETAFSDVDYESGVSEFEPRSKVSFIGVGKDNKPFDTSYENKKAELETQLSTMKNSKGSHRKVGHLKALAEKYKVDDKDNKKGKEQFTLERIDILSRWLLEEKERRLTREAEQVGDTYTPLKGEEREEALADLALQVDMLDEQSMAGVSKEYDKTHQVIRSEVTNQTLPDVIAPDAVEKFRDRDTYDLKRDASGKVKGKTITNTPDTGRIFLERRAKVDEETGEVIGKNEDFLTSTMRLIQHVWRSEKEQSEGRTNDRKGKGALGEFEAFLRGLSALIESDGTFTGVVKWRDEEGVMHEAKGRNNFPGGLKLMKGNTVADALKGAKEARMKEGPTSFKFTDLSEQFARIEVAKKEQRLLTDELNQRLERNRAVKNKPVFEHSWDVIINLRKRLKELDERIKNLYGEVFNARNADLKSLLEYPEVSPDDKKQIRKALDDVKNKSAGSKDALKKLYARLKEIWPESAWVPGNWLSELGDEIHSDTDKYRDTLFAEGPEPGKEIHRNDENTQFEKNRSKFGGMQVGLGGDAEGMALVGPGSVKVDPKDFEKGPVVTKKKIPERAAVADPEAVRKAVEERKEREARREAEESAAREAKKAEKEAARNEAIALIQQGFPKAGAALREMQPSRLEKLLKTLRKFAETLEATGEEFKARRELIAEIGVGADSARSRVKALIDRTSRLLTSGPNIFSDDATIRQALEARPEFAARALIPREERIARAAIKALVDRGLGPALGRIRFIFAFAKDTDGARYIASLSHKGRGIIGITPGMFDGVAQELFTDVPSQIRFVLAHEVGHMLDVPEKGVSQYSNHPDFEMVVENGKWVPKGKIAREMYDAWVDETNSMRPLLHRTPFGRPVSHGVRSAQRELFAQAVAMFYERSTEMRGNFPLAYAHIKEVLNEEGLVELETKLEGRPVATNDGGTSQVTRPESAESRRGRRTELQTGGTSPQRGDNLGSSESAGLERAGAVPGRLRSGGLSEAELLQRYLDAFPNRNVVWANFSKRALAEGNAKNMSAAIAAAKKQFGELPGAKPAKTEAKAAPEKVETLLAQVEKNVAENKYPPFAGEEREQLRAYYRSMLTIPEQGQRTPIYAKDGTLLARAYDRVVIGDYGAYIEIDPSDFDMAQVRVKPGQEFRLNDPKYADKVKYDWYETRGTKAKVYLQKQGVRYADYKPGKIYLSPDDVRVGGQAKAAPEKVEAKSETPAELRDRLKEQAKREGAGFHAVPMNYYDGKNGLVMRTENRGKSTLELIREGKRTATTRNEKPDVEKGDILMFYDGKGGAVGVWVTKGPYKLPAGRDAAHRAQLAERWSALEGWAPEMYERYIGAWQYQYERLDVAENEAKVEAKSFGTLVGQSRLDFMRELNARRPIRTKNPEAVRDLKQANYEQNAEGTWVHNPEGGFDVFVMPADHYAEALKQRPDSVTPENYDHLYKLFFGSEDQQSGSESTVKELVENVKLMRENAEALPEDSILGERVWRSLRARRDLWEDFNISNVVAADPSYKSKTPFGALKDETSAVFEMIAPHLITPTKREGAVDNASTKTEAKSDDEAPVHPLSKSHQALYDIIIKDNYKRLDSVQKVLAFARAALNAHRELQKLKWNEITTEEANLDNELHEMFKPRTTYDWETLFDGLNPGEADLRALNEIVREGQAGKTGKTMASRQIAGRESPHSTPEQLRTSLGKRIGKTVLAALEKAGFVKIHATLAEARAAMKGTEIFEGAQGFFDGKTVHLVAENLSPDEVTGTLLHEFWHKVLNGLGFDARGKNVINIKNPALRGLMSRLAKLDRLADSPAGQTTEFGRWVREARKRIPEADKSTHLKYLNELGAYAISAYENEPRSLPLRIAKWVQDFLAELKTAIAMAFPDSKIGKALFENMNAADFAAIARRMLTDVSIAAASKENVEPMFALRLKNGAYSTREDHVIPETHPRYKGSKTGDLAYLGGVPIRLNVGMIVDDHRGFGAVHIDKESRKVSGRSIPQRTGDRAEDLALEIVDFLEKGHPTTYNAGGKDIALHSRSRKQALILHPQPDMRGNTYYSVVTLKPAEAASWGSSARTESLAFPGSDAASTSSPPVDDTRPHHDTDKAANATGTSELGDFAPKKFDLNNPDGVSQVHTVVKKKRTIEKHSKQAPESPQSDALPPTPEEIEQTKQYLLDTLGDTVDLIFRPGIPGRAGKWTEREIKNLIELSLARGSNVLTTGYHESLHEFFALLGKHGAKNVQDLLLRVASNHFVTKQLNRLLEHYPDAIADIKAKPEEALAYAYQFWLTGQITLGPETQGLFKRIANWFKRLAGVIDEEVRAAKDAKMAEAVLAAFRAGAVKDPGLRDAVFAKLRENVEQHDKQLDAVGALSQAMTRTVGKVVFSAAAMMDLSKNRYLVQIRQMFDSDVGEVKEQEYISDTIRGEEYRYFKTPEASFRAAPGQRIRQGFFDAMPQWRNVWLNRYQNIVTGAEKEDMEQARVELSTGVKTHNPAARKIVDEIRKLNERFFKYFTERGAMRWDPDEIDQWGTRGAWVPVAHKADYFPRVWDSSTIRDRQDEFKALLLRHHGQELQSIAQIAMEEVHLAMEDKLAGKRIRTSLGPTSKKAVEANDAAPTITPEMVAEEIVARLANGSGKIDLSETSSEIGISPLASAVNRRELSWLDMKAFDDFTVKDLTRIMSSYITEMVKRTEYTVSFGAGGEKLRNLTHLAVLEELGGQALIKKARAALPAKIDVWKINKAEAMKAGKSFPKPFPTLRSVGQDLHFKAVGEERGIQELQAAIKKLDPAFSSIRAMEGTLGNDISPAMRSANSVLVTYQALRLLPMALVSSMNDAIGLVARGGELADAWKGFVRGMREIRLSWAGEKSTDAEARAAEIWGTVEAAATLDALGQVWGSMYLEGRAKRISDALFRWNGMEAWNRAMRVTATTVATRQLADWAKNGIDLNNRSAVGQLEHLFGQGAKTADIRLNEDGTLDITDAANRAAVMRWVNEAVVNPNAAHRPAWASNPHFAAIWQLKQFAFSFHRVMLRHALKEAALGNYRPGLTLVLGYAPVMIAADAVKEMLLPGEEPPWMQGGLDDMLSHGMDRAGVFGVPQLIYDGVRHDYGASLFGPTISQILNAPFDEPERTALGSLPGGVLLRRAA